MPSRSLSVRLYRALLKLYPPGFREDYAKPMELEFRDELAESRGLGDIAGLWIRLLVDVAISLPSQVSREALQDLRHTLRHWGKCPSQPGFAIVALALAIGSNTGVFSVVNALLLRSLPFQDPGRLALLRQFLPPHDSARQFHDWRKRSLFSSDAAVFEELDVNLGGLRVGSRAHVAQTSGNFFSVLGVRPVLGAAYAPEDDVDGTGWGLPGRNAVAVIAYGLWQNLFGGDAKALGATIRVDGNPLTVVGVAPPGFDYPGRAVLWKPAAFSPGNNGWGTVARLKPGVSWAQAHAAFRVETKRLEPEARPGQDFEPAMASLQDGLAGEVKDSSLLFMGAVLLVLLIACTNVANLLLARAADREGEFFLRSALGASRARLARQFLTECLLLCFVAGLGGLLLAWLTTVLVTTVQPPPLSVQSYSVLDWRVLAFTGVVCGTTALLFGVLPSLYAGRIHLVPARASHATPSSRGFREILVGLQVALTLALLAASVSVGRAEVQLMSADRGYVVKGVATVNVSLEGTTRQLDKRQLPYFEEVLDRIRKLPGVRSASATEFLPLDASAFVGGPFGIDGRPAALNSMMIPVLSEYFQTIGGKILYGREFNEAEVHAGARVAVVNERFAEEFGAPRDALGHQLTTAGDEPRTIVGVVEGMEYETDPTTAHGNQVFLPSQTPGSFSSAFIARVEGRAEDHLGAIRDAIQAVDPQVPVFGARTMEQRLDTVFARPRFYRAAVWFFAGFATLLVLLGIHGIVSYAVARRTQEVGVRLALGTTPTRLRGMLLRQGLLTVLAGVPPGLAGAYLLGGFLQGWVVGAKPLGLAASGCLVLGFAFVAAASLWSATRRIRRLDVTAILRSE